jgi:B-box zinc finger
METPAVDGGNAVCKSHPKTPARFLCGHCQKYFCDLCVNTRGMGKYCRTCGQPCTPLRLRATRPAAAKGFYARLPGAFIYPFRGIGLLILVCATIAFLALDFISAGIFTLFATMAVYGFVFLFMQNIIHTTTSDENEPLSFPEASGLFGAFFELAGTILVSYGLAIGLLVAKAFFEVDIPAVAILIALGLGCLYFPMAFLAVAMKDSVMAANPLIVVPTIFRMPLEYLVTSLLLMCVFGVRFAGDFFAGEAGSVSLTTRDMSVLFMALGGQAVWAFIRVYLLTVSMRILGLLYLARKDRFGWFSH